MKKAAQIISVLFHPYLLPTYGGIIWVSYTFLEILPLSIRLLIVGGIFFFSCLLPLLLHISFGFVQADKPHTRHTEMLLYAIFLIFAMLYLRRLSLPTWAQSYFVCAALSTAIVWIINTSGWRISFIMSGLGSLMGLIVMMLFIYSPLPIGLFIAVIIITGLMGTALQLLDRHTLAQTLTGWVCGIACTPLASLAFHYNLFSL
ncbi:MAG: hypothetical protein LUI04_05325 [Porphyromonadaceae bacterium]|nr:hypothetical protein [Porphyromonadaceae bacterium]